MFRQLQGPVKIRDLFVVSDGKLAIGHSIQNIRGTGQNGKPVGLTLRVSDGYGNVDGRCVIIHEHISVPVDLGTGEADLAFAP